jgi:hypothetical protein
VNFEDTRVGKDEGPDNLVGPAEFERAYLEVSMMYESAEPAIEAVVFFEPTWPEGSTESGNFRFDLRTFALTPSFEYHSVEIPLRELHLSGGGFRKLTHTDLVDLPVHQAAVGGQWNEAAIVRVDAIRIYR